MDIHVAQPDELAVVLEVVATNDVAKATWEALGFELIEYRLAASI